MLVDALLIVDALSSALNSEASSPDLLFEVPAAPRPVFTKLETTKEN